MKTAIISIFVSVLLVTGMIYLNKKDDSSEQVTSANNVTMEDGIQVIEVTAKGGYQPESSVAKAGVPTILRFKTEGTFDCSSAIRIASMNISKNLATTGTTDIELGSQEAGTLQGSCGMGMYPFEIKFEA